MIKKSCTVQTTNLILAKFASNMKFGLKYIQGKLFGKLLKINTYIVVQIHQTVSFNFVYKQTTLMTVMIFVLKISLYHLS